MDDGETTIGSFRSSRTESRPTRGCVYVSGGDGRDLGTVSGVDISLSLFFGPQCRGWWPSTKEGTHPAGTTRVSTTTSSPLSPRVVEGRVRRRHPHRRVGQDPVETGDFLDRGEVGTEGASVVGPGKECGLCASCDFSGGVSLCETIELKSREDPFKYGLMCTRDIPLGSGERTRKRVWR